MSNKFEDLASVAGDMAEKLGGNLKHGLPGKAVKWVETGAALTALRTGSRIGLRFARRNPVLAVAALAGAGALMYATRRAQQKMLEAGEVIEGKSKRVAARKISRAKSE
jgi:hypothetical protein